MTGSTNRLNPASLAILILTFVTHPTFSMDPALDSNLKHHIEIEFTGDLRKSDIRSHSKVVVCYLGTWATYRIEDGKYDLIEHFDPMLCSHLIYSFAGLDNVTNKIKVMDPYLDLQDDYGRGWYSKATGFKAKYPHLKVLLAVGGWNEGSEKYSNMVANKNFRKIFIDSASELIRKHGFDGLDLDWEFPGSRGGKPEDKQGFTMLAKELRLELDSYGLLLTGAFSAAPNTADSAYEYSELSKYFHQIHIMCYDYHGSWDSQTYHNAPLNSAIGPLSVVNSVEHFISKGVDPEKIVVGVPFYGRTFLLKDGISEEGSGITKSSLNKGFQGKYTKEDGFMGYNEICLELLSNRGDWSTYWDSTSEVPYMRNGNKWISFDNTESLTKKVEFIISRGLKGVMIWSIDTDDFLGKCSSVKNPLLRSINSALSAQPQQTKTKTGSSSSATNTSLWLLTTLTMLITSTIHLLLF